MQRDIQFTWSLDAEKQDKKSNRTWARESRKRGKAEAYGGVISYLGFILIGPGQSEKAFIGPLIKTEKIHEDLVASYFC